MRKDGRRRSKAGLKFDFSGGEAEKSWTTGNNFLLQEKMPNMPRCHGYWRRIPNYWKNMSNGTPARRLWNRWLQLFITLIWYLIIFNQWAEKRSERLAKPAKVTRGKSNLSSWKVPSKIFGSSPTILTMLSQVFLWARQAWSAGGDDKSSWGLFNEGNRQRPGGW